MPLWHKDDFELEAYENQQMQKDAFLEPPSPDLKQKPLKNGDCHESPLPGELYGHKEDGSSGPGWTCTNKHYSISFPVYLPSHGLLLLKA